VTPPPDAEIVTPPVEADTEIPEPAVTEVTPVLVIVGVLPPATEIPVPAETEVTPDVVCVVASLNVRVVLLIDTGMYLLLN
jgi:restriction endonuclease